MKNITTNLLKATLLIPVVFGWAIYQGVIPSYPLRLLEFILYGLFFIIIHKKVYIKSNLYLLATLLIWFISYLFNDTSIVLFIFFLRSMLLFYVLTLYVPSIQLTEKQLKNIFTFIWRILLFQIPLSLIKLMLYGVGETPFGLCGTSWTTFIFLIGVSFSVAFYLNSKKTKYILYIIGFCAFGIIGGKRSIIFFFPILLIVQLILHDYKRIFRLKTFLQFSSVIIIFGYLAIRLLPTLNPENKVWGEFNLSFVMEYSETYNNAETKENGAIGRSSALTSALLTNEGKGTLTTFLGNGPGLLNKTSISEFDNREIVFREFNIGYGVTGLVFLIIQVGILGSLFFFIFIISLGSKSLKLLKKDKSIFWSSFHLGTLGTVFTISFISYFYDVVYKEPMVMTYVYTIIGISFARYNQLKNNLEKNINKYSTN